MSPSKSSQWAGTSSLHAADQVESATGEDLTVISVKATGKVEPIYNFTVADTHTYLVGKSHAVVHNRCNIPAWKKMGVDWEHIFNGHMEGGARAAQSGEKSLFPNLWGEKDVMNAVEEAYKNGRKVMTQGDRILIRGTGGGSTIEMWVNTATKTVETAYPVL